MNSVSQSSVSDTHKTRQRVVLLM